MIAGILLSVFLIKTIFFVSGYNVEFQENELAHNFFKNLRADPVLVGDLEFSEDSKSFIDRQVANFLNLVTKSEGSEFGRSKRSLLESETTLRNHFVEVKLLRTIPSKSPIDVVLFQHNQVWYAACLEEGEFNGTKSQKLRIRKLEDSTTKEVEIDVSNGVKVAAINLNASTIIIVADNSSARRNFERQTSIIKFTSEEGLEVVQKINTSYVSHVELWEQEGDVYMAVAGFMSESRLGVRLEAESPVYKWRGRHFDLIQFVGTSGVSAISHFSVRGAHYLAVANAASDNGDTETYSEIFKYDVETERFRPFQKILTYGCEDMKVFEMKREEEEEYFLAVANTNEKGKWETNPDMPSIIYKFVDDYFIPFQSIHVRGVKEWLPVTVESGEIVLFAATIHGGIKCFHYNGWHFVESQIESKNEVTVNVVKAMHFYGYQDKSAVVIVNGNGKGSAVNMFEVTIPSRFELKTIYKEMFMWCLDMKKSIESMNETEILGESPRGDVPESSESMIAGQDETDQINKSLQVYASEIKDIQDKLINYLGRKDEDEKVIEGDVKANHLILNNDGRINSIQVDKLNGFEANKFRNILDITKGFEVDSLELESLSVGDRISPKIVNEHSVDEIVHTDELKNISNMVVDGTIEFLSEFNVGGNINNLSISSNEILLSKGDQTFKNFSVQNLEIGELRNEYVDKLWMNFKDTQQGTANLSELKQLKAKKVVLNGFINDVDLKTLDKYALKINGTQEITKNYYIHNIVANNLDTKTLSEKKVLEDLIVIRSGNYSVNKDVKFTGDLSVNKLKALKQLDRIPVKKGKLDILLRNSPESQYISGLKSFENLVLLNPIHLRGKIRSKIMDTMNPSVTVEGDVELNQDVRVTGDVRVEELVKSRDVVSPDDSGSLLQVRHRSLKLTDAEIPVRLRLSLPVNTTDVVAERINDIDPTSWVVNGANAVQVVEGGKTFPSGLRISGGVSVSRMNGVDVEDLEKNALRVSGDQIISGTHHVERVVAQSGIKSDQVLFGSHEWNDVIETKNRAAESSKTFKDFSCNTLTATSLNIVGFANGLNVTEMFRDAVSTDEVAKIPSHKTFKSLTVENLNVKNNYDFIDEMRGLETSDVKLAGDVYIANQTTIGNIHFNDTCNGIGKQQFTGISKGGDEPYIINGTQEFESITVYRKVYVDSKFINDVNLTAFQHDTVKIDEPFEFETVTFNKIDVRGDGIDLGGHVDHLDLDNIFENNKDTLQCVIDEKTFEEDVVVEGSASFENTLNGFNVSDICDFNSENDDPKSIIIGGDAYFSKGPHVSKFNEFDVEELENFLWFTDKPATLNGYISFNGNVTFKKNITVAELVNDIKLELLKENYLSKSKNQTVSANMMIDEVLFFENVSSPWLKLGGNINGINIETFVGNVLLDDDQTFEHPVHFEACRIVDAQGDYLINGLNFEKDVMRYDQKNIVTGKKTFKDLSIGNLILNSQIMVQNVDLLQWIQKGALTHGAFRISGTKHFQNITLDKGLSLEGFLNGREFNETSVMLRDVAQNVTGRKTFFADGAEGVAFKALKIKGLVNDVDVAELAHNQVQKTGNNMFKSEIRFHGNLTTKNLILNDLYQGVNVTQLLHNITTLNTLNNFEESYYDLQKMLSEVEDFLFAQAYFLHYYKPVAFTPALMIFGRKTDQEKCQIMAINYENDTCILQFLEWDEHLNMFKHSPGYSVSLGPIPNYIDQLYLGETDYIYIEHRVDPSQNAGYGFLGKLLHFKSLPNTTEFDSNSIRTNGSIFSTSFELEARNQYCLLFIDFDEEVHIACINAEGEFYSLGVIAEKTFKASTINIDGDSYLVTIKTAQQATEPCISIWKFNNESSRFELYHRIHEGDPISLTTVTYGGGHYVAVAYGHLQNTMHLGRVVIRRFDKALSEFTMWQNVHLGNPTHIEFSILPSKELVLYILTENPTEPFVVYIYEGISGFSKKIVGSAIPNVITMNQFSVGDKHFVATQHSDHINIIQAIFKGEKLR